MSNYETDVNIVEECVSHLEVMLQLPKNEMLEIENKGNKYIINDEVEVLSKEFSKRWNVCFNLRKKLRIVIREVNGQHMATLVRTIPLHVHSDGSLLDGASKDKDIVSRAEYASALTNHGSMFGYLSFYKQMIKAGKKPILGFEAYTTGIGEAEDLPQKEKSKYHLVLLAKDLEGYHNIVKLTSLAYNNVGGKFPQRPLVSHENLKKYSKGVIALSACLGGEIQKNILNKGEAVAEEVAKTLASYFDKGDFYLEIQRHNVEDEKIVNPALISLSKKLGLKLVATTDSHYTNLEDKEAHDVLLCISTQRQVSDQKRFRFDGDNFHILSSDEMERLFVDIPEALDNQFEIAEKCNVKLNLGELFLPNFDVPVGFDSDCDYLKHISLLGYKDRFSQMGEDWKKEHEEEYLNRLMFELETVKGMGFSSYFLIVHDFIDYAKKEGIPVGPGRGSAAGSLMSYCLGITNLDPIPYGLLFERFLNPERVSWPDIDIDFCYERRHEVIEYVRNKYGQDAVAQIATFGTLSARSVVRDVAKTLGMTRSTGYPYNLSDKLAKAIPKDLGITLKKALEEGPDFRDFYKNNSDAKKVIDIALKLEKNSRHASVHACGVPIVSKPIYEILPVHKNKESDMWITQVTKDEVEELGALKMDFLGLKTLTVISKALELINPKRKKQGLNELEYHDIPLDDVNVYKFIANGNTAGVFQLESPGMQSFMKELYQDISSVSEDRGIEMFERLIAGVSLYRPGPMDSIPTYIKNMRNHDEVDYSTPLLQPILEPTYGVIVYQEQVMQVVRDLAGYSLGRSDLIRRAMGKKDMGIMEREKKNFIFGLPEENVDGCLKRGVPQNAAEDIWDIMVEFAKYAFNKSHAAVYAMLGVTTAWLKNYYPTEFAIGTLNTFIEDVDKLKYYIGDIKKQGIQILPPDVNYSEPYFTEENGDIRFALKGLKNVNNCTAIVEERKNHGMFSSFQEMAQRLSNHEKSNKRLLEALIYSGSVDSFEGTRAAKLEIAPKILSGFALKKKTTIQGQVDLFGFNQEIAATEESAFVFNIPIQMPKVEELEKSFKLSKEKEYTNLYVSEHPLDDYLQLLAEENVLDIVHYNIEDDNKELEELKLSQLDGQKVKFAGILNEVTKRFTKKNDTMYTFVLEDLSSEVRCVIFPRQLEGIGENIMNNEELVLLDGHLTYNDFGLQVIVDSMVSLSSLKQQNNIARVWVLLSHEQQVTEMKSLILNNKGETPLYAKIIINDEEKRVLLGNINYCQSSFNQIKNITNHIHLVKGDNN